MKRFLWASLCLLALASYASAADTVVSKKIQDNGGSWGGSYAFLFGNASDGTGEAAVVKVSTSTLSGTPTEMKITKMVWSVQGMAVSVLFDATTDDRVAILTGDGVWDAEKDGGPIKDPASSGHTGNVLFTTHGHSAGDGYTIYMELKKVQ